MYGKEKGPSLAIVLGGHGEGGNMGPEEEYQPSEEQIMAAEEFQTAVKSGSPEDVCRAFRTLSMLEAE